MVQIDAYKLLYVSEETMLGLVDDIRDTDWLTPMQGLGISFDWIFGHYAAIEDWFLHHLNDVPYELSEDWQTSYWADNSGLEKDRKPVGRTAVTAGFQASRQRLFTALKWDLLHLNRCVKPGFFPPAVKTRGDAWLFVSAHSYWHIGELQALRSQLGYEFQKPKGIHH